MQGDPSHPSHTRPVSIVIGEVTLFDPASRFEEFRECVSEIVDLDICLEEWEADEQEVEQPSERPYDVVPAHRVLRRAVHPQMNPSVPEINLVRHEVSHRFPIALFLHEEKEIAALQLVELFYEIGCDMGPRLEGQWVDF